MRDVHVVVDNSAGGDPRFAGEVARRLRDEGFSVEVRAPSSSGMLDTAVHFVLTGLVLRVSEQPDPTDLARIEATVRSVLLRRPARHRRARVVPVHLGDTARAIHWIDLFED